jgi:hypothetical protein
MHERGSHVPLRPYALSFKLDEPPPFAVVLLGGAFDYVVGLIYQLIMAGRRSSERLIKRCLWGQVRRSGPRA